MSVTDTQCSVPEELNMSRSVKSQSSALAPAEKIAALGLSGRTRLLAGSRRQVQESLRNNELAAQPLLVARPQQTCSGGLRSARSLGLTSAPLALWCMEIDLPLRADRMPESQQNTS
eukprot:6014948-Amphidinium_carterae.1